MNYRLPLQVTSLNYLPLRHIAILNYLSCLRVTCTYMRRLNIFEEFHFCRRLFLLCSTGELLTTLFLWIVCKVGHASQPSVLPSFSPSHSPSVIRIIQVIIRLFIQHKAPLFLRVKDEEHPKNLTSQMNSLLFIFFPTYPRWGCQHIHAAGVFNFLAANTSVKTSTKCWVSRQLLS